MLRRRWDGSQKTNLGQSGLNSIPWVYNECIYRNTMMHIVVESGSWIGATEMHEKRKEHK